MRRLGFETLLEDRKEGRIRYIGITTSHGSRHDALEKAMASQPIRAEVPRAIVLSNQYLDRFPSRTLRAIDRWIAM